MHSALPLLDPVLWLRFLFAAAVVVWLPGWLLAGRWLGPLDRLSRFALSIGIGLILPFVFHALLGRLGVGFHPLSYLLFVVPLGGFLGFWPRHRRTIASWAQGLDALDPRVIGLAMLATLLLLGGLIIGFGDLPAPPHVHDASNHAWMTLQIVRLETLDSVVLAQTPSGRPELAYLPGLHAAAALISRLGGVAPYVSVWMLALTLCALIPLAWTVLWRAWKVPAAVLGLAVLLPVSNQLGPGGILSWGGFGQVVGFFMVPLGALVLNAARRSRAFYPCLLAGMVLGGIAYLHASEMLVAIAAAFFIPRHSAKRVSKVDGNAPRRVREERTPGRGSLLLSLFFIALGLLMLYAPEAWRLLADYSRVIGGMTGETKSFGDALNRLWRSGGREDPHQLLFVLAWFFGWRAQPLRRITIASMVLGIFYLALQTLADPITRFLAKPFYSQAPRILYLQFYLLPPLMAWPLVLLYRRLRAWRGDRTAEAVIMASMAWVLITGLRGGVESYANSQVSVPFTIQDYEHAVAMQELVEPIGVVANLWDDGSTWAMQVSGLRFIHPFAWPVFDAELGDVNDLVSGLAEEPWPPSTLRLLEKDEVGYLYVSDTVWGEFNRLRRADFDGDLRFEPLLVGESSTLYRIRNR